MIFILQLFNKSKIEFKTNGLGMKIIITIAPLNLFFLQYQIVVILNF